MEKSRRHFIQTGFVAAGTAGLTASLVGAAERKDAATESVDPQGGQGGAASRNYPAGAANIMG